MQELLFEALLLLPPLLCVLLGPTIEPFVLLLPPLFLLFDFFVPPPLGPGTSLELLFGEEFPNELDIFWLKKLLHCGNYHQTFHTGIKTIVQNQQWSQKLNHFQNQILVNNLLIISSSYLQ